jgi:hypothetical protein
MTNRAQVTLMPQQQRWRVAQIARPRNNDLLWLQLAVLAGGLVVWLFGDWLLP